MYRILAAIISVFIFSTYSFATDVCTATSYSESSDGGQFTLKYRCVLDNSDTGYATFSDSHMSNFKGAITSVEGVQGPDPTFPNALVVSMKTSNGVALPGFPSASITGGANAAAWVLAPGAENPIPYMGNLQLLFTTNTTAGAIFDITIQGILF